jgi:hypothetical protein
MMSPTHTPFQNSILYSLLMLLLLTCPMKREIKQALDIPAQAVELGGISNQSLCLLLSPERPTAAKQKVERAQKNGQAPFFPLSASSLAIRSSIRQKVHSGKTVFRKPELFIYYRKLLI